MKLPSFLLDEWLTTYEFARPALPYNLASSTGPIWTLGKLLALSDTASPSLEDLPVTYAPPQGCWNLREAIAEFYNVDPDWVVVTTGASEALSILFCLASEPGKNIVIPFPAFSPFGAMARAWGLDVNPYVLCRDSGFRQTATDVLASTDANTALVIVNSPHNPTGAVMGREQIAVLAAELQCRRVPLVLDEVYHPLYFDKTFPSAAGIENVVVLSDMSKAFSTPGLRTGWMIDPDPERRQRTIGARGYFTISGSPVLEAIASHTLKNRTAVLGELVSVASANLDLLADFMERVSGTLSWIKPVGGTIAFPWFADGRDSRPFCQYLASKGVLVVPGDCYELPSHLRIGFGAQTDGFDTALSIMAQSLTV